MKWCGRIILHELLLIYVLVFRFGQKHAEIGRERERVFGGRGECGGEGLFSAK